jgi:spore maturation protein SpmA
MLNILWLGMLMLALGVAFARFLLGDATVFAEMMAGLFAAARSGFEIALGLTGIMALWLGLMRIAERAGLLAALTRLLAPLFERLFPQVPRGHPALGAMTMNMAANMLGLDNAATPLGIKAMQELQTLNPRPDTASDAQILFLVINTASVTLLPVTIFTYRAQMGAANPTDIFIPLLLTTYFGTLAGLVATAFFQKVRLWDPVTLAYLGVAGAAVGGLAIYFGQLPAEQMQAQSALLGNGILLGVIALFLAAALVRRVNAYEAFIEGAREGFQTAVTIIPYLVAMLVAIALLRASGALGYGVEMVRGMVVLLGLDARFVDALPTALMKPLSGSGARAMMIETMQTYGADSFAGRLASIIQGSTETTFYVLAVYFGAVNISRVRHALACGLIADFAGILAAIFMAYLFFG